MGGVEFLAIGSVIREVYSIRDPKKGWITVSKCSKKHPERGRIHRGEKGLRRMVVAVRLSSSGVPGVGRGNFSPLEEGGIPLKRK